jgi:hypothetical protein
MPDEVNPSRAIRGRGTVDVAVAGIVSQGAGKLDGAGMRGSNFDQDVQNSGASSCGSRNVSLQDFHHPRLPSCYAFPPPKTDTRPPGN